MRFEAPGIRFHSEDGGATPTLRFTFSGTFTEEAAIQSTAAWGAELQRHPTQAYHFIWDCMEMEGFEFRARTAWLECMQAHQEQIAKVTVVSGSIMIRSAAKVLLRVLGVEFEIRKGREEDARQVA